MKACLNCNNQYENKREASKFCSAKCRVAFNRKNPQDRITKVQVQVLYNSMLEMMGKVGVSQERESQKPVQEAGKPLSFDLMKQAVQLPQVAVQAIMRKYWDDKRELGGQDEYNDWLQKLYSDNRLTTKQKDLIKNTNQ